PILPSMPRCSTASCVGPSAWFSQVRPPESTLSTTSTQSGLVYSIERQQRAYFGDNPSRREGAAKTMIVGVPKEVKNNEFRVALVPSGAEALVESGHTVLIETGAGLGTAIEDSEYAEAGAEIVPSAAAVFDRADMI